MIDLGNGIVLNEDTMKALDMAAASYYDYHDKVAKSMIDDPEQQEYFDRWLAGQEYSPDPSDTSKRQVYDAIVYLAGVGCG